MNFKSTTKSIVLSNLRYDGLHCGSKPWPKCRKPKAHGEECDRLCPVKARSWARLCTRQAAGEEVARRTSKENNFPVSGEAREIWNVHSFASMRDLGRSGSHRPARHGARRAVKSVGKRPAQLLLSSVLHYSHFLFHLTAQPIPFQRFHSVTWSARRYTVKNGMSFLINLVKLACLMNDLT